MPLEADAAFPLSDTDAVAQQIGDQFVVRQVRDVGAGYARLSGRDMRDNCLCAGLTAMPRVRRGGCRRSEAKSPERKGRVSCHEAHLLVLQAGFKSILERPPTPTPRLIEFQTCPAPQKATSPAETCCSRRYAAMLNYSLS